MSYLLVFIPLFFSFFGIYYFILTGSKSDKEVRFIPLIFLFIIIESILFLVVPSFVGDNFPKVVINFLSVIWVLTFLLLFLYELMEKSKLSIATISMFLIPAFMLTTVLIVYLILGRSDSEQGYAWLFYGYFAGMLLITTYFVALFYKRSSIKKMRYPRQNLIQILFIQVEIVWIFLIVWFVVNYRSGNLFAESLYIFFNLIQLGISLTLYLYLFDLYKSKLHQEKLVRLKDFVSVSEVPVMVVSSSSPSENQKNELMQQHGDSYKKSALSKRKLNMYKEQVEDFFMNNRSAYLDPDFNLEFLSNQTGISRYHLSQVFNVALHSSFPAFVNEKRILYACELIKENNGGMTVSKLMEKCGMRSRASFYYYFKKVAGCMPGEYLFS